MSVVVKYHRRKRIRAHDSDDNSFTEGSCNVSAKTESHVIVEPHSQSLDTKHKTQVFLDIGQADFSYCTCKICGLFYARGHAEDEKLHAAFHMNFLRGVPFKGWQKERVITAYDTKDERVILVLHSDPAQHQLKIKEVMKVMEKDLELEPGSLLSNGCKVYLYISLKKVVGCVVAEPITQAYASFTETTRKGIVRETQGWDDGSPHAVDNCYFTKGKKKTRTLIFGNLKFEREIVQNTYKSEKAPGINAFCSDMSLPAVCGVRGLWVSRKKRGQGIATRLLDAMRTSFVYGVVVDRSQCAFLQPTRDGQEFAATYCNTDKFLVYY